MEFESLFGDGVPTTPRGALHAAFINLGLWTLHGALLSENINHYFELTVNTCRYSSMKSGSLRHPWLSLTDTLQNGDLFTEMGI